MVTGTPAAVTFSYTGGNKRIVTDALTNATTYTLNDYGNPKQIAEPLGKTTTMTWSIDETKPDNVMTSRTDANGKKTTFEHDSKGNITKETDPLGNSITTSWNTAFSQPESRSDRNGKTQRWDYDSKGNLTKQTDGEGKSTSHGYNSYGERISTTDPRSNSTSYSYDTYGNPATTTGAEGSISKTSHDIRGRLTESTDPNGNKTSYSYNVLDYPQSVTYPALTAYTPGAGSTNVKLMTYDPLGNLTRETDRTGLTLDYSYTPRNQVAQVTRSGSGLTSASRTFAYDNNGNLTTESDWKNSTTRHTYDALNRRITTSNRLGFSMTMGYDLNGNLTSEKDFEGRINTHDYDELNRRIKTVQPALSGLASGELKYGYYNESDPKTNLKTVTDQEGHTTTYEYNGRYQKAKQIDAKLNLHSWSYDAAGNLESETDEENRTTSFDYDKQNRLTKTTLPQYTVNGATIARVINHSYDAAGNRTSSTDPRGNVIEQQYDQWNRLWKTSQTDETTYTSTIELDGEGRTVKTTDQNGTSRTQSRDARGLVTSSKDGEGNETKITYDANGNTLTVTEPNSTVTTNEYDADDKLKKSTETTAGTTPASRSKEIVTRDKVGNPTQVKDYNGNSTTSSYNALNLPESACTTVSGTPNVTYCTENSYLKTGTVKSVKDRRGNTTHYEYDALNRRIKTSDAIPAPYTGTIETSYDGVGNVTGIKDKRGITTSTTYNALNLPESKSRAGITVTFNSYDANGNLTKETDANGNATEQSYSKRNLRNKTTHPQITPASGCATGLPTATRQYTFDGVGNILTENDELGKITTHTYDRENRRTSSEFAGETTKTTYTFFGAPKTITKPLGNGRIFTYDGFKRLTSVTEGGPITAGAIVSGLTTSYEYDNNGNQTHQRGPSGDHTEYSYDELNRKTAHIQHLPPSFKLTSSYSYDGEGSLTKSTDPKGQQISHSYDELNRRTETTYPGNSSPYLTLTKTETAYDGNNNVTKVTETKTDTNNVTVSDVTDNTYDSFDRLLSSTQRNVAISYSYDNNGNRTKVATPNGQTSYTFDERNRLSTATTGVSSATNYCYRQDNLKLLTSYPNGATEALDYFDTNRIKTISNKTGTTVISSFAYEYDANGNRTKQTERQNGLNRITRYAKLDPPESGYDNLDRLISYTVTVGASSGSTDYTYDGYNRKTEKLTENTKVTSNKTYDYDTINRLTSVTDSANSSTISYTYDENGNTIKKNYSTLTPAYADTFFDYDVLNRLVQVKQGSGATAAVLGQYDYDENNLRIRHRNSERGNVDYFHDGRSIIEERNSNDNTLLARYSYADKLLSLLTPAGSQYFHHDALGSTVNLTSESGTTQASYALDPWGHIVSQQGDSVNRQVFTGKEIDWNTGLVYFGARYYDPDTARFINQDSYLGESSTPPSLHRYLYAYSNPTVYIDLEGYASRALITGRVNSDSDAFEPYSNQTHDTGNVVKDFALATRDNIFNLPAGVANIATDISSRVLSAFEIPDKILDYATKSTVEERSFVGAQLPPVGAVVGSTALLSKVGKLRHELPKVKKAVQTVEDIAGGALTKVKAMFKEERVVKKEASAASDVKTGVDIELKYKDDWTKAQRAEADTKAKALSEATTVKTEPKRSGTSAASRYKSAHGQNSISQGKDIDHVHDLQLGGADEILNMNPLDMSVNRSLGKQIQLQMKDYPVGTVFDKFFFR